MASVRVATFVDLTIRPDSPCLVLSFVFFSFFFFFFESNSLFVPQMPGGDRKMRAAGEEEFCIATRVEACGRLLYSSRHHPPVTSRAGTSRGPEAAGEGGRPAAGRGSGTLGRALQRAALCGQEARRGLGGAGAADSRQEQGGADRAAEGAAERAAGGGADHARQPEEDLQEARHGRQGRLRHGLLRHRPEPRARRHQAHASHLGAREAHEPARDLLLAGAQLSSPVRPLRSAL